MLYVLLESMVGDPPGYVGVYSSNRKAEEAAFDRMDEIDMGAGQHEFYIVPSERNAPPKSIFRPGNIMNKGTAIYGATADDNEIEWENYDPGY